jgi:hypothetical protein
MGDNGQARQPFFVLVPFFDFFPVRPGNFPGRRDQGNPFRLRQACQESGILRQGFQDGNAVSDGGQGVLSGFFNESVLFRVDGVTFILYGPMGRLCLKE